MKILRLEIERCGQCPYCKSVGLGWGYCLRERAPMEMEKSPPCWCPLPEAEPDADAESLDFAREIAPTILENARKR